MHCPSCCHFIIHPNFNKLSFGYGFEKKKNMASESFTISILTWIKLLLLSIVDLIYRHSERRDLCENVIFGAKWQNQGNYRCSIMLTKFNCIVVVQYFFPSELSNLESFLFSLHNIWKSGGIIFLGWSLRWCLKKANKIKKSSKEKWESRDSNKLAKLIFNKENSQKNIF